MAKALSYKSSTTVTLKITGAVDIETGTIFITNDEGDKEYKILDLLKDFDGEEIELTAKVKSEEELELLTDEEDTTAESDYDE